KEELLRLAGETATWEETQPGSPEDGGHFEYEFVRASDVIPRAKNWLWEGRLLRGSLELMTGIPGVGKSQVQLSFVANVTTGSAWPDGAAGKPPANVIMVTIEDTLDKEIIPRLMAVKANLERVYFLKRIKRDNKSRMFLLNEDIDVLERMIKDIGEVGLVGIDPITAFMGKVDSHRATDVRGQLGPLADL